MLLNNHFVKKPYIKSNEPGIETKGVNIHIRPTHTYDKTHALYKSNFDHSDNFNDKFVTFYHNKV